MLSGYLPYGGIPFRVRFPGLHRGIRHASLELCADYPAAKAALGCGMADLHRRDSVIHHIHASEKYRKALARIGEPVRWASAISRTSGMMDRKTEAAAGRAIGLGCNDIDPAPSYGESEKRIGNSLDGG
jgi:hypothetical protein